MSKALHAPTLKAMEAAGAPQNPESTGRKRAGTHSGRLLLRMPASLHADLARASERTGVSLNAYINDALARVVGRGAPAGQAPVPRALPRRRLLERLLVVNVVVLAAVGVLAILLLVQALR